ncbi:M24 family metallopeptidase [Woodsholea maritima]|uniref:M24 family metallopeptidase n=1 Tax=Woodsholea maritima TaxID=240237 RepID=UPI000370C4BC|nr:Xaa-Pro peptidase family protein [Woodsholea maritima]
MTLGIGGTSREDALQGLINTRDQIKPITLEERQARITKACALMDAHGLDALLLPAGTSLTYFTGVKWYASERFVGALILRNQSIIYINPHFEAPKLEELITLEGEMRTWQEHESPYALIARTLKDFGVHSLGIEEQTPFFIFNGIAKAAPDIALHDGTPVTAGCRMIKSPAELALMQHAKTLTLDIHKRAASMLYEGITNTAVMAFIDEAHRKVGSDNGSTFCIVAFGQWTAFPHGPKGEHTLKDGDMVLIDTGCAFEGYTSDITRTYVFGEPSARQRELWNIEKEAQAAAFEAAQLGVACEEVDKAARAVNERHGYGPGYQTPGMPHRTGHGIGLDIHEWPYLTGGTTTRLEAGMCFSNEPMITHYGEFGVRLEDHFYMTETGPRWFTPPSHSIDEPFKGV